MIVQARYKDVEPEFWFDVELTDDQRMIDVATGQEIKKTNLLFRADDEGSIIDMQQEWEDYKQEQVHKTLRMQARYLLEQLKDYDEGIYPKLRFNGRYFIPVFDEE